jgi:predicted nucleotide-binding protein (sugar kinase/HSP70/actin superfamily)
MKVTFPHLGTMHIFCKAIAETAQIPYIVPPETSRRTLTLGVLHSNECICLPFKIILGNFIEALQMGADTIVMVGSGPPCRLGLYDLVQKVILEDMGLHFRWLTIPPRLTWQAVWKNYEETKELRKELTWRNILLFPYGLRMGWKKMMACEALEKLAMKVRPREVEKGETQKRLKQALSWVDQAKKSRTLNESVLKGMTHLNEIEQDPSRIPFRIAIVGELYTVMDPHINRGVEQKLGELGAEVTRSSWFSTHIRRSLRWDKSQQGSERFRFLEASKSYLGYDVGAECNISIGEAIVRAQEGYDGVVHLMPFACMPETTASGILNQTGKDWNIPILTIILDEQEIEGRIQTLLEAFVEMLQWKRKAGSASPKP